MSLQAAAHARETFERVLLRLKGDTVTTLPGRGQQQGSVNSTLVDCGDGTRAPYTAVVARQLQDYDLHPKQLEWVAYVSEGMQCGGFRGIRTGCCGGVGSIEE
jgi:hypothetical protein